MCLMYLVARDLQHRSKHVTTLVGVTNKQNTLHWRHNEHDGVSNHQSHDCLVNRLFRCKSKKTPQLRVTGLCAGISPVTGEFAAQRAGNAENVSIGWRHHEEDRRPNKLRCMIKLTKLSTYYLKSGSKKKPGAECHRMASMYHKYENQSSIRRNISHPREDLGPAATRLAFNLGPRGGRGPIFYTLLKVIPMSLKPSYIAR